MRIQTLTRETLARLGEPHFATGAPMSDEIIAPEGSELAGNLRSRGWIVRAGWRSRAAGRQPIWLVRFERPVSARDER